MPDYTIRDPTSGRTVTVRGDTPPTDADLDEIFASLPARPKAAAAETPTSVGDVTRGLLNDNPSLPWQARAGLWLARKTAEDPVSAAATAGAVLAVPATGGASLLPSLAAAGLGAAGGAGLGLIGQAATGTGSAKTAGDVAATMTRQGLTNAAGEGAGRAIVGAGKVVVPAVLKKLLKPGKLLDEYPDLIDVMRREQIPIGESSVARGRNMEAKAEVDRLLFARDQQRPKVAGLLGPAQEAVPMGTPSIAGEMPGGLAPAHATLNPDVTDAGPHRLQFLGDAAQPTLGPTPELAGPGVLMREMQAAPGKGAYPGQVDPRKIAQGLTGARAEVSDRALNARALEELDALEMEFLANHPTAKTLTQTNKLKRAEQRLANRAFRAAEQGTAATDTPALFHKGIASGAQREIEKQAPEVIPLNLRTQELGGLLRALRQAEKNAPGPTLNPMSWPGVSSRAAFLADDATKALQTRGAQITRQGLLSKLAEILAAEGGR